MASRSGGSLLAVCPLGTVTNNEPLPVLRQRVPLERPRTGHRLVVGPEGLLVLHQ